MHPTIFASGMDTNIVGLSYNQKFRGFFDLLGLAGNVIDVEQFVDGRQTKELYALLLKAIRKDDDFKHQYSILKNKVMEFNSELMS